MTVYDLPAHSRSMISTQSSTHSAQIHTPGPAISLPTRVGAFPQNEQWPSRAFQRLRRTVGIDLILRLGRNSRQALSPRAFTAFEYALVTGTGEFRLPCQFCAPAHTSSGAATRHPDEPAMWRSTETGDEGRGDQRGEVRRGPAGVVQKQVT
jgi:hypothetical protein